jgi:G:T-mismatch repair DNA endonuclease (very short patch repair protein)
LLRKADWRVIVVWECETTVTAALKFSFVSDIRSRMTCSMSAEPRLISTVDGFGTSRPG